jgi:hypothetical protein
MVAGKRACRYTNKKSGNTLIATVPAVTTTTAIVRTATVTPPPVLGIGLSGQENLFIGDHPGTTGFDPGNITTAPWGEFGNQPIAPGTSAAFPVMWVNVGNVPERVSVLQQPTDGIARNYPEVPRQWISYALPVKFSGILQPGQHISITVTVTVPAKAKVGLYSGQLAAVASSVTPPKSGVNRIDVGAAATEFVRVIAP